jgi:hypothetical protein
MPQQFNANDLFQVEVDNASSFPLNLGFVPKKNLASKLNNSGIYFLTYKGELIYIGYAIKEDAISRMKKQLEGITLRGKNLVFNDLCQETIQKSNILNSFFSDAILARKKSVETSPKRILFAEQHWKDFAFLDQYILSNFVFHWFPLDSDVAKKCAELKNHLLPRCNNEGVLPSEYEYLLKPIN